MNSRQFGLFQICSHPFSPQPKNTKVFQLNVPHPAGTTDPGGTLPKGPVGFPAVGFPVRAPLVHPPHHLPHSTQGNSHMCKQGHVPSLKQLPSLKDQVPCWCGGLASTQPPPTSRGLVPARPSPSMPPWGTCPETPCGSFPHTGLISFQSQPWLSPGLLCPLRPHPSPTPLCLNTRTSALPKRANFP